MIDHDMLRVITWNTARRKRKILEQCSWLGRLRADVVALQEVTPTTLSGLRDGLSEIGLVHCVDSLGQIGRGFAANRTYGLLVASRFAVESSPYGISAPWPEKALSVVVRGSRTEFELYTTHIPPGSSNGWVKVATLEAVYEALVRRSQGLRLLCGDFNTPQLEFSDGTIVTWAQYIKKGEVKMHKTIKGGPADRWDCAERQILTGLRDHYLVDTYRYLHGYGVDAYSWVMVRRAYSQPRRFDHIFASLQLNPVSSEYLYEARDRGLSDHAPLRADFSVDL